MGRNASLCESLEPRTLLSAFFANGQDNDLVKDPAGTEHLAYYDTSTHTLKYSSRAAGGDWTTPVAIDGGGSNWSGKYVAINVDSNNMPGVAYLDEVNADLRYSKFNGTTWSTPTIVDSLYKTGYYPSIVFNASNNPIISYYYASGGDLRVATYSGSWAISTIDTGVGTEDVGRYTSIAIQPSTGYWGIAYENSTTGQFKYARQVRGGGNVNMTVDTTTTGGGGNTSLAFDNTPGTGNCVPTFTYYDAANADLKFARASIESPSASTDWTIVRPAQGGKAGMYSNLWYQSDGRARVTFYHETADSLYEMDETSTPGVFGTPFAVFYGGGRESEAVRVTDTDYTYTWVGTYGLYVNDTSTGKYWTEATAASFGGRMEQAATTFVDPATGQDTMWIAGGVLQVGLNTVYRRDVWKSVNGITWTQTTGTAEFGMRSEATLSNLNGQMWLIGGRNSAGTIVNGTGTSVVYSSTDGVTWNAVTNNLPGMYGHATAVMTDPADGVTKLWVVGGRDGSGGMATVYKSADGSTWTTVTSSAAFGVRYDQVVLPFAGKLYLMGGHDANYNALTDVWSSSDGATWTLVSSAAQYPATTDASGVVYDNKMWIISGNQVWFSFAGDDWTPASISAAFAGRDGQASVVFQSKMWVLGGKTYNPINYQDDIWSVQ